MSPQKQEQVEALRTELLEATSSIKALLTSWRMSGVHHSEGALLKVMEDHNQVLTLLIDFVTRED